MYKKLPSNTEIKRQFRLSLRHFNINKSFWLFVCGVIVTITMCMSFLKYMSFIVTDIQCVKINKDLERKLSKTYNLDLASEVREKTLHVLWISLSSSLSFSQTIKCSTAKSKMYSPITNEPTFALRWTMYQSNHQTCACLFYATSCIYLCGL